MFAWRFLPIGRFEGPQSPLGLAAYISRMDASSPLSGHVVLVDDDRHLLHALRFAFEADGYCVTAFDSGEALLGTTLSPENICIVIDERLPGLGGVEAMKALRDRGYQGPGILMTSNPSRELAKRAAAANLEIVEKPLMGDGLAKKVNEALAGA